MKSAASGKEKLNNSLINCHPDHIQAKKERNASGSMIMEPFWCDIIAFYCNADEVLVYFWLKMSEGRPECYYVYCFQKGFDIDGFSSAHFPYG